MSIILVASPTPLAGKTAVAAGIVLRLASDGRPVAVARVVGASGDPNAADDARVFAALPFPQEGARSIAAADVANAAKATPAGTTLVLEAPRGGDIAAIAEAAGAQVILVVRGAPASWPQTPALGQRLLGAIAVAVPEGQLDAARAALQTAGLRPLGVLPEDRGLIAPSIGEIAAALGAEVVHDSGDIDETMEYVVIAPVNSDGGRPYFWRYPRKAVVTRVDKPDIILSAMHHGARCLVLCGLQPPMLYVVDRARHEEVTILLSRRSTVETMRLLESAYERSRFQGEFKAERIVALLESHADLGEALGAAAT